jgi:hypothetical protein
MHDLTAKPSHSDHTPFRSDVVEGLSRPQKTCRWLYDEGGSDEGREIHIHVPAGATPRDGPSAGVVMFSALSCHRSECPKRHGHDGGAFCCP